MSISTGGRAGHLDRRDRSHRGVRHGGDRAAWADAEAAQRQYDGVGASAAAHGLAGTQPRGEFGLEGFDFLAEDVPAGVQRARDGGINFGLERAVAGARIGLNDHR